MTGKPIHHCLRKREGGRNSALSEILFRRGEGKKRKKAPLTNIITSFSHAKSTGGNLEIAYLHLPTEKKKKTEKRKKTPSKLKRIREKEKEGGTSGSLIFIEKKGGDVDPSHPT